METNLIIGSVLSVMSISCAVITWYFYYLNGKRLNNIIKRIKKDKQDIVMLHSKIMGIAEETKKDLAMLQDKDIHVPTDKEI